jgi:hypothetical protein
MTVWLRKKLKQALIAVEHMAQAILQGNVLVDFS